MQDAGAIVRDHHLSSNTIYSTCFTASNTRGRLATISHYLFFHKRLHLHQGIQYRIRPWRLQARSNHSESRNYTALDRMLRSSKWSKLSRQRMVSWSISVIESVLTSNNSIVAVHGLNGDATSTWTSNKGGICWLDDKDLLPRFLPNARILTWGYNANVISTKARHTSADRILQHAQTLIAQLVADREVRSLGLSLACS